MEPAFKFSFKKNILLVGPSHVGKSVFLEKMLSRKDLWAEPIKKIYYYYGINSDTSERIRKEHPCAVVQLGLPPELDRPEDIFEPGSVIIFDDLTNELLSNSALTSLLIRGTHHLSLCTVVVSHFLFGHHKESRMQSVNYHLCVLFRNPKGMNQVATYARQMSIGATPKTIIEAYKKVHAEPYKHLLIDMCPHTDNSLRLLSNVFMEDSQPQFAYV